MINTINENDLKLRLLAGLPIQLGEICTITLPILKEIIELGEENYNRYLSGVLVNKDQIEELKETNFSNLDIIIAICATNEEYLYSFLFGLKMFLREEVLIHPEGFLYFSSDNLGSGRRITAEIYEVIQYILMIANNIENKKEDYNPANERARKFIEKLKLNKKNAPKKKNNIDLHSIISGLAWKSNNCNIFNIFDLTLYQLYDAYYRLENIDNYNYTLQGIYAGTIDNKKINMSDINWAKTLKL